MKVEIYLLNWSKAKNTAGIAKQTYSALPNLAAKIIYKVGFLNAKPCLFRGQRSFLSFQRYHLLNWFH